MTAHPDVRDAFVGFWTRMAPYWGIPPAAGAVHAFLLSRAEPSDAEQIMAALSMSRGAVSMACRELVDWGLVAADRLAGSRRTVYRAEEDVERVIRAVVAGRKRREWNPIREQVGGWVEQLKGDASEDARALRRRLEAIEAVVLMLDEMAESFLGGGTIKSLGMRMLVSSSLSRAARRVRARHADGRRPA